MIERRRLLGGLLATAGLGAVMAPIKLTGRVNRLQPASGGDPKLPSADRHQGMGATDADGMVAVLPFKSASGLARQIWVNAAIGSPNYNGMSPYPGFRMNGTGPSHQLNATGRGAVDSAYGPCAALAAALSKAVVKTGPYGGIATIPNQFFFAEGQTFTMAGDPKFYWGSYGAGAGGKGATAPACFQSYDPADPLNLARHGRAGMAGHGPKPIWLATSPVGPQLPWPNAGAGGAHDLGGWAFRGLCFRNPNTSVHALQFKTTQNNMLFENMELDNVTIVLLNGSQNTSNFAGFTQNSNNIIRKCAIYGQYDIRGSHACGIFVDGTNLIIEDCIFWHNGWKVGASRREPVNAGGPDIYRHCIYADGHRGVNAVAPMVTVRRTVMMDASAGGLSMRGNHTVHHNVIIDCPTPEIKGGGSANSSESPDGNDQFSYCELILGGADVNPANPRYYGFSSENGTPASYHKYSLWANAGVGYGAGNNFWLQVDNRIKQPSYQTFQGNRAYAYATPARRLLRSVDSRFGGSDANIHITDIDNVLSTASPMTNDQLYAAIGFSSKQAMIAAMIADPTQPWAYALLNAAATGFNFSFDHNLAQV